MEVFLIGTDESWVVPVEEGALSNRAKTINTEVQTRKKLIIHQVKSSCGTP